VVPRSEPDTFDRVPAARERYAMSISRMVQPARAAFIISSSG
jgi:hypothetical protein